MTPMDELDARLLALEARVSTPARPALAAHRRFRFAPVAVAAVLVLASATVVGAAGVAGLIQAHPGVENPGQPLAGAQLECMSPPEAAAYLLNHGFANVVWQVETGDLTGKTGHSVQVDVPPAHGYVVPGSIVDGTLLMVVDQRSGATGSGACAGEPMP